MKTAIESACQKIIMAGWATCSDGNVNAPTGHFALIELPENEMSELFDAMSDDFDEWEIEAISNEIGNTLFVLETIDGHVFVKNVAHYVAWRLFDSMSASYENWVNS